MFHVDDVLMSMPMPMATVLHVARFSFSFLSEVKIPH